MAAKTLANEREYVIPLRREWMKVVRYKRTARSVRAVKAFIAKHMRIPDRDVDKVKLDVYLNNEMWFRGTKKPPARIKVRAKRDGDIIRVELVGGPEMIKFAKAKQEKRHKKVEKKKVAPAEKKTEEKKEEKKDDLEKKLEGEKTEEDKKKEGEKEKSVEQANLKIAEQAAKAQKHTVKGKGPIVQRKALKK